MERVVLWQLVSSDHSVAEMISYSFPNNTNAGNLGCHPEDVCLKCKRYVTLAALFESWYTGRRSWHGIAAAHRPWNWSCSVFLSLTSYYFSFSKTTPCQPLQLLSGTPSVFLFSLSLSPPNRHLSHDDGEDSPRVS